jgi:hypothetical protein
LAHFAIHPWVCGWPRRPIALIKSGKDQSVSGLHSSLNRAKNRQSRMQWPLPPHRCLGKELGQNLGKFRRINTNITCLRAKVTHHGGGGLTVKIIP